MITKTQKFYNRISPLYPVIDAFLKPQRSTLIQHVNALPAGKLLDVGVGSGGHLPFYQRHTVTGIDCSASMLKKADKIKPEGTVLMQMQAEDLHFENETFDYAVLSHVIAVVDDAEKVLQEVHRVLKPGGKILILNHFTPDNGLKYIDRLCNPLAKLFHFRSLFQLEQLPTLQLFSLEQEIRVGVFSYFKLLIYQKV